MLVHICLIKADVISTATSPPAYIASTHMLSGPGALLRARFLMVFDISSLLGGTVGGVVVLCSSGYFLVSYMLCQ